MKGEWGGAEGGRRGSEQDLSVRDSSIAKHNSLHLLVFYSTYKNIKNKKCGIFLYRIQYFKNNSEVYEIVFSKLFAITEKRL